MEEINNQLKDEHFEIPNLKQYTKDIIATQNQLDSLIYKIKRNLENTSKMAQEQIQTTTKQANNMFPFFIAALSVCTVCILVSVIITYFTLSRSNTMISNVENYNELIYKALYDDKGFSVLTETIYSEKNMPKIDPDRYHYLKNIDNNNTEENQTEKKWYKKILSFLRKSKNK